MFNYVNNLINKNEANIIRRQPNCHWMKKKTGQTEWSDYYNKIKPLPTKLSYTTQLQHQAWCPSKLEWWPRCQAQPYINKQHQAEAYERLLDAICAGAAWGEILKAPARLWHEMGRGISDESIRGREPSEKLNITHRKHITTVQTLRQLYHCSCNSMRDKI